MRTFILLIFISLLSISCETKVDRDMLATTIEKDNLSHFERLSSKIKLDTFRFDDGRNALHYALQMNSLKISNKLIDEDFMLNETDSLNFTPLLTAIHSEKKEITNKLLGKNVSVNNIEYLNGFSALHYAIYNNNISLAKKLIAKKADVNLKSESIMGNTPLHLAIAKENAVIAKLLLDNNATDTIKDINDDTAIDIASKSKSAHILALFYDKMSQETKETLFINTVRNVGDLDFLNTMLDENWMSKKMINDAFVFSKDTTISRTLLNKGATIKALHSQYNYGAIHYAAICGNTTMLDFLLKNGANINQLAKKGTVSPLMYAAQLNGQLGDLNKKTKKLQINVNVILYDLMGKSSDKTKDNSLEAVKYLIEKKANTNFKNKNNENALYYATSSFNHDVIDYLKEAGVKETKKFVESKSDRMRRIMNY